VAIVAKGKLIALDSPLALRQEHTERKADVILNSGERLSFNMLAEEDRKRLAELIASGQTASLQTREFDFHATFLKLTGLKFE